MALYKWTKNSLQSMGKEGYNIVPCKSEEEAEKVKAILKEQKKCAQAGYAINSLGETVYFCLVKPRGKKKEV